MSENVIKYEPILESIFAYLTFNELNVCKDVCETWRKVAKIVDCKRRIANQYFYLFRIARFEDNCSFVFDHNFARLSLGTELLEKRLNSDIPQLYSPADIMILIEGNNVKIGKKRRWKRAKVINAIRSKLSPECRVIGIDAHYGIIGKQTAAFPFPFDVPNTVDCNVCGLFGISCTLFPKFEGVHIEIFHRLSELEVIEGTKGVVLFSSGVSFRGEYLQHENVQNLINALDGNLALAGAQVNERIVKQIPQVMYSDETANYFFLNGPPPYNPMYNPQQMSLIGIKFSGSNVLSCSIVIKTKKVNSENVNEDLCQMEEQLLKFKKNLDFDADCSTNNESVAFLFFNYDCYRKYAKHKNDPNAGVDIFYSIFPKTKIIGLLTHAQYEYNYWPNIDGGSKTVLPKDENNIPMLFPSTKNIASFIIFYLQKSIN